MLNIRRVDHNASHTHCWRVTVQRRKRIFVRDFSDGRHASQQHALQAAQLYRDKLVKAYPLLSKAAYCAIPSHPRQHVDNLRVGSARSFAA
jgi:hypothetical protein